MRVAETKAEFKEVYRLTRHIYAKQNYCEQSPGGELQHYPHLDEIDATTTIIETKNSLVVGTISVTIDNEMGIHVDEDFPVEMKEIRKEGIVIGCWRVITDDVCRNPKLIRSLVQESFKIALESSADIYVISVNPKHEGFYKRALGMKTVAAGKCAAANNYPAVLMTRNITRDGITRYASL